MGLTTSIYNKKKKKCDFEGKKKKLISLVRSHSANKISNYNREGGKGGKKE